MVDELELLKKDWQKQEATLPKLSKEDIYPMLLKKSSSIVKWIFLISIAEFIFWVAVNILAGNREKDKIFVHDSGLETFSLVIMVINYVALAFFVLRFYMNYKKIEATDTAKTLMANIFRTRQTVKYYIWFNVIFLAVGMLVGFVIASQNYPEFNNDNMAIVIVVLVALIAFVIGLLVLFYRLIYGILLRRLKANYLELKKMEV